MDERVKPATWLPCGVRDFAFPPTFSTTPADPFTCGFVGLIRGGLQATASGSASAPEWGAGAASMVFIYTFVFGATWLTVPWLYPAEIFPICVRAKGNAWGVVGWSIGCA